MRYKLISAEGKINYKYKMSLEEMQSFVDGYIEMVGNVICNEEGLLKHLPQNVVYPHFVGNIIVKERTKKSKEVK
jgi:hypothetical protein